MTNSDQQQTRIGENNVRTTGSMARRLLAGAFLAFVMSLTLAGVASGASPSPSPSPSTTTTTASTTTTTSITRVGSTTARTGANLAIPLIERLLKTPGAVDSVDYSITINDLKYRWEWDPIRNDPRFQKLLKQPAQ